MFVVIGAIEVHHKTYENIGKEDILKDLVGLCSDWP